MEILVEIALQVFVWILEVLGELLLQLVAEAVAEALVHAVKGPWQRARPVRPWLAAVGYLLFGAVAGGLSVRLLPDLFIRTEWLRVANLLVTPVAAGLVMGAIGAWRSRRDKDVVRIESFAYGFCFAAGMAVVRFAFGH